jgi:crossover junction endodeoxyribonuclease RusA
MNVMVLPPDRRRRDIDNCLKSLLDALQHGGAYADDSQIVRLFIEKGPPINLGKAIVRIRKVSE